MNLHNPLHQCIIRTNLIVCRCFPMSVRITLALVPVTQVEEDLAGTLKTNIIDHQCNSVRLIICRITWDILV